MSEPYLNPETYNEAPAYLKAFFYLGHHLKELLIQGALVVLLILAYPTIGSVQETISAGVFIEFFYTSWLIPNDIGKELKSQAERGRPLPESIPEFRRWFTSGFKLAGTMSAAGLALVGIAWTNPPEPIFKIPELIGSIAFFTNASIMSSVSAFAWSRMLKQIEAGRLDKLFGGFEVVAPLGLAASGTVLISMASGLSYLEDSASVFGPAIFIGLYVGRAFFSPGFVSPKTLDTEISKLKEARTKASQTLQWLEADVRKGSNDHDRKIANQRRTIGEIDRTIHTLESGLKAYSILVNKIISLIREYQIRYAERDLILKEPLTSPESLAKNEVDTITEAISLLAPTPERQPESYLKTRQFNGMRVANTMMDFPIILQGTGMYSPLVTLHKAQRLANKLDTSTYERYAAASFEYFMRVQEMFEVAWLWHEVKSKRSGSHCIRFLEEFERAIEEFNDATSQRIYLFKKISKIDPQSQHQSAMGTVEGGKFGLSKGREIAAARLRAARKACALVRHLHRAEPVVPAQSVF